MVARDSYRCAGGTGTGSTGRGRGNWPLWTDAWSGPYGQGGTTDSRRFVVGRYASGAGAQTLCGSASYSIAEAGKPTRAWNGGATPVLGSRLRRFSLPGDPLGAAAEGLAAVVPDRLGRRRSK